ncbi:preprotein translocase subunit SecE [Lachnospiraceae bacterium 46-61]
MEENNTTNPSEKNESKKQKKQPNKNAKPTFSETIADYKAEYKKIVWPTKQDLARKTVTVILTSLLVGVIVSCMDIVYSAGYDCILSLLG